MHAIGFIFEPVDLDGIVDDDALLLLERLHGRPDLRRRGRDDPGVLAGAEPHLVEPVQPDSRRRRIDRIHHVVERSGKGMDVLAVERGHKCAVETLDDGVRERVAPMLNFLDLVGFVPDWMVGREHLFQQLRAGPDLIGKRLEVVEKPLIARNQAKTHSSHPRPPFRA